MLSVSRRIVHITVGVLSVAGVGGSIAAAPLSAAPAAGRVAPVVPRSLVSVSCPTPRFCIAVGESSAASLDGGPAVDSTLAEQWNGTTWHIQSTPNPPNPVEGTGSLLVGVSCVSVKSCTAVGNSTNGASLAEHWNGSSWTIQPTPTGVGFLVSVSCRTAKACIAVGEGNLGVHGAPSILAERWNGNSWRIQPTARMTGLQDGGLFSVSCSAANACTTVGGALVETRMVQVVERWNGHHWTRQKTPTIRVSATLSAVSCNAAKSCTSDGVLSTEQSLVEHWNGKRWAFQTPRHVLTGGEVSATGYHLAGVACRSVNMCIAVGQKEPPSDRVFTLTELWNGKKWTVQKTPAGGRSSLISVSCGSTRSCMAVGATTLAIPVTESWNGKVWTVRKTPNLPG